VEPFAGFTLLGIAKWNLLQLVSWGDVEAAAWLA
jgi:hypothetical protein